MCCSGNCNIQRRRCEPLGGGPGGNCRPQNQECYRNTDCCSSFCNRRRCAQNPCAPLTAEFNTGGGFGGNTGGGFGGNTGGGFGGNTGGGFGGNTGGGFGGNTGGGFGGNPPSGGNTGGGFGGNTGGGFGGNTGGGFGGPMGDQPETTEAPEDTAQAD
ncbi:hypothetical protein BaRGS_00019537 [Batillaria attramentaria]|uniref:Uncharacterized protein n=1 Tax=Batillaria attramentaria TaxID=370345 RepID=A0ABD0KQ19_9CAEN